MRLVIINMGKVGDLYTAQVDVPSVRILVVFGRGVACIAGKAWVGLLVLVRTGSHTLWSPTCDMTGEKMEKKMKYSESLSTGKDGEVKYYLCPCVQMAQSGDRVGAVKAPPSARREETTGGQDLTGPGSTTISWLVVT